MSPFRAEEFEKLGPWITGFKIGENVYGGSYVPAEDRRVQRFVADFRTRATSPRILECGCLEAGHTAVLAASFPQGRIIAVDLRPDNLRKARFILESLGLANTEIVQEDLSAMDAAILTQRYEAIFCVGFLYHLAEPAAFLQRAARRALSLAFHHHLRRGRSGCGGKRLSRPLLARTSR